jgi:hypothetical protein
MKDASPRPMENAIGFCVVPRQMRSSSNSLSIAPARRLERPPEKPWVLLAFINADNCGSGPGGA